MNRHEAEQIADVLIRMLSARAVGNTTAMVKGMARTLNSYLITSSRVMADHVIRSAIKENPTGNFKQLRLLTLIDIAKGKIRGLSIQPVFIDHVALAELLSALLGQVLSPKIGIVIEHVGHTTKTVPPFLIAEVKGKVVVDGNDFPFVFSSENQSFGAEEALKPKSINKRKSKKTVKVKTK
jgi:hypothetical protein